MATIVYSDHYTDGSSSHTDTNTGTHAARNGIPVRYSVAKVDLRSVTGSAGADVALVNFSTGNRIARILISSQYWDAEGGGTAYIDDLTMKKAGDNHDGSVDLASKMYAGNTTDVTIEGDSVRLTHESHYRSQINLFGSTIWEDANTNLSPELSEDPKLSVDLVAGFDNIGSSNNMGLLTVEVFYT